MEAGAKKLLGARPAGLRAGSEGVRAARLKAAAPRYLATGVLLVLLALGARTLFLPPPSPPAFHPPAAADPPSEDFALQFARAYLTYDAARPARRTRALAPFLSSNLDSGAGFFAAAGAQRVLWEEVASDQPALAGGRVITVAAGVSTQRLPLYLSVTVSHERGRGLSLVGYPSFVGAPAVDAQPEPQSHPAVEDKAVLAVVGRVVRNYLAGSAANLKADLTGDAVVTLPTVTLAVERVNRVEWIGDAGGGAVLATVSASDARGAEYTLTYELGIAYRERPYVDFIEVIPTDT
jgi:hypothetical protein